MSLSEFYLHHLHSWAREGQKKVLDSLELEFLELVLQEVVNYHVVSGDQTIPTSKIISTLSC